jgi:competence ComEA-like helix-hairpin-helix protein
MKSLFLILFVVGFVSMVSASCSDGQIDINLASLEKLDELTGIGPAYAGRIVENRPFSSVEDLVKVKGIGEITLGKIVDQGLACVDGEVMEDEVEEEVFNEVEKAGEDEDEIVEESVVAFSNNVIEIETTTKIISLNGNEEETKEELIYISKNAKVIDYLSYGFVVFLIFIIGVLIWDKRS